VLPRHFRSLFRIEVRGKWKSDPGLRGRSICGNIAELAFSYSYQLCEPCEALPAWDVNKVRINAIREPWFAMES
jgi:hypothetical protein